MSANNLPTFVIIGAMKCATTSLHYYLSLHPEIYMSKIKELWYFVEERNWPRGPNWYQSHFKSTAPARGEASTGYTMYPRFAGVPERMHAILPNAKLIYIVRDPIERIVSDYMHGVTAGVVHRRLEETIVRGYADERYIARSMYYYQIAQYLPYFPAENIHVITTESLRDDREDTLAAIFRFLNVDDRFSNDRFSRICNPSAGKRRLTPIGRRLYAISEKYLNRYHPEVQRAIIKKLCFPYTRAVKKSRLDDSLRKLLADRLRPDVEQLRAFTKQRFAEWTI